MEQINESILKLLLIIPSLFQPILLPRLAVLPWWAANRTCSSKNNAYKLMQREYNSKKAYYSTPRCL